MPHDSNDIDTRDITDQIGLWTIRRDSLGSTIRMLTAIIGEFGQQPNTGSEPYRIACAAADSLIRLSNEIDWKLERLQQLLKEKDGE